MALVRCITEMGMGVDVHGLDYTLAAKRAVFDAIHHSSLGFARLVGATADDMTVHVLIGVPHPEKVNADEVAASLPHGHAAVQVVAGGLERLNEDGRDGTLIANAIITVSIDHPLAVRRLADIAVVALDGAIRGRHDFLHGLLQHIGASRYNGDCRPGLEKRFGHRPAQPTTTTREQRHAPVHMAFHHYPSS